MTAETPNILIVGSEDPIRPLECDPPAGGLFRCTRVQLPGEAVEVASRACMDAAVLDVSRLTPQDALLLIRRLRDEVQDLPLVLIAGSASAGFSLEAMRIGVVDCLMKPFSDAEIVGAIDRALSWRRSAVRSRQAAEKDDRRMARRTARICRSIEAVSNDAALGGWLSTLYRSDPRTHEHVRRVAQLTHLVAARLGVIRADLDIMVRAALLHDVGKLATPRHIVGKTGPLSERERDLVRSHAQSGYAIAMASPFLAPSAPIVLAVRERFDGNGYPLRLKGEGIPLGARVIAVVEVLDALTSARAQLEPVSLGVANAELVRGAGVRFDPRIVSAWLRAVDELTAEWALEPDESTDYGRSVAEVARA